MIPPFTLSGSLPPFTGENPTAKALMSPYETSMVSMVQRFGTSAARFLKADLAAVSSLLEKRSEDQDPIGYLQLTARQSELEAEVARLQAEKDNKAKVALFFGGRPVLGSRGILADFGGKMLEVYQDLVSKRYAAIERAEPLRARGVIPLRDNAKFLVTEVARGSFGFVLEEAGQHPDHLETQLQQVVSDLSELIYQTAHSGDEGFEALAEMLDDRLLISLRTFFKTLDDAGATMRVMDDHREVVLHREDVERGRLRADSLETEETEIVETGIIFLLPDSRRFEFQSSDGQSTKRGTVAESCMARLIEAPERSLSDIVGQQVEARFLERTISQPSGAKRQTYRLVDIDMPIEKAKA